MKYCVVTPYYKEDRSLLEGCMDSVRRQTMPTDHIMVADGFPQDWIDGQGVRHFKLDCAHGDYGNFARGLGALIAVAEAYDGIAFLDADNNLDADHIETCLAAAQQMGPLCDYVVARRRFTRPDGSVMEAVLPAEMPFVEHVDTNCYFFLPRAYHMIYRWCTMPRELSAYGDRLFHHMCTNEKLVRAITEKPTVNYLCMFEHVYRDFGEEPPPGCKPPVDVGVIQDWLKTVPPERMPVLQRLTGLQLFM